MSKTRRAPARLDDAIVQFDHELRILLVSPACAELERLRAVPLALRRAFVGTAHAFAAHGEGSYRSNGVNLGPAQARSAGRGIDPGRAAIDDRRATGGCRGGRVGGPRCDSARNCGTGDSARTGRGRCGELAGRRSAAMPAAVAPMDAVPAIARMAPPTDARWASSAGSETGLRESSGAKRIAPRSRGSPAGGA